MSTDNSMSSGDAMSTDDAMSTSDAMNRGNAGRPENVVAPAPVSPVIRRWQIGLIAAGIALLAIGAFEVLTDLKPDEILGLAVWFLGALIIHDGIIAAGVFGIQLALRRSSRRVPLAVLGILQGAVIVGAIIALIVIPQIYKSATNPRNSTIVPLDYTTNLVWFYVGMAVVTAITVWVYLRLVPRRQKLRPSSTHD